MKFKKIRKMVLVLSAIMLVNVFGVAGFAEENNKEKINTLSKKYNLKDATVIPEGVEPIEFKTVEEAEKYLKELKSSENIPLNLKQTDNITDSTNNIEIMPLSTYYGSQTKSQWISSVLTYLNLQVSYTYSGRIFLSCTRVTSFISGYTLGLDWTQTGRTYSIIDGGRTLSATAYGVLDSYLLINGVVKIYSSRRSISKEFYL